MNYGEMARLSDLTKAEIDALAAEGIGLDPRQIVELNAICLKIEDPSERLELARGFPVRCGNATLYPLTIYAGDWMTRWESRLESNRMKLIALAYAMAHGREDMPEELEEIKTTLKQWRNSLKCRLAEIEEACSQVLDQDAQPDTGDDVQGFGFGNLSAMLVAHLGGDPKMWEYQCSIKYANAVLAAQVAKDTGSDGMKAAKRTYQKALAEYVWQIRKKHNV
jgi:hypothetical protein